MLISIPQIETVKLPFLWQEQRFTLTRNTPIYQTPKAKQLISEKQRAC